MHEDIINRLTEVQPQDKFVCKTWSDSEEIEL